MALVLLAVFVDMRNIKSGLQQEIWLSLSVSLKLNQKQNINLDFFRCNRANQILVLFLLDMRRLILSSPRRERQKTFWKYWQCSNVLCRVFFNSSSQFSVPKWKTSCSKPKLLFLEIFHVKKYLVGWATFFLALGKVTLKMMWCWCCAGTRCCVYIWVTWGPILKISSTSKHG